MSSLAYKCVFYRTENNGKGEPQGTEFWKSLKCKNEMYHPIELKK